MENLKVIASYGLFNALSLNLYDIDHHEDRVLVGFNDDEPTWCDIDDTGYGFDYGGTNYDLSSFMRV